MTFKKVLKKLNIEDYEKRIFNSNSHGELFHIQDYIILASFDGDMSWFRDWFTNLIKWTDENCERPESVFQHIPELLMRDMKECNIGG